MSSSQTPPPGSNRPVRGLRPDALPPDALPPDALPRGPVPEGLAGALPMPGPGSGNIRM